MALPAMEFNPPNLQTLCFKAAAANWSRYGDERVRSLPRAFLAEFVKVLSPWHLLRHSHVYRERHVDVERSWRSHCRKRWVYKYQESANIFSLKTSASSSAGASLEMERYLEKHFREVFDWLWAYQGDRRFLREWIESGKCRKLPQAVANGSMKAMFTSLNDEITSISTDTRDPSGLPIMQLLDRSAFAIRLRCLGLAGHQLQFVSEHLVDSLRPHIEELSLHHVTGACTRHALAVIAGLVRGGVLKELLLFNCLELDSEWRQMMWICAGHTLDCLQSEGHGAEPESNAAGAPLDKADKRICKQSTCNRKDKHICVESPGSSKHCQGDTNDERSDVIKGYCCHGEQNNAVLEHCDDDGQSDVMLGHCDRSDVMLGRCDADEWCDKTHAGALDEGEDLYDMAVSGGAMLSSKTAHLEKADEAEAACGAGGMCTGRLTSLAVIDTRHGGIEDVLVAMLPSCHHLERLALISCCRLSLRLCETLGRQVAARRRLTYVKVADFRATEGNTSVVTLMASLAEASTKGAAMDVVDLSSADRLDGSALDALSRDVNTLYCRALKLNSSFTNKDYCQLLAEQVKGNSMLKHLHIENALSRELDIFGSSMLVPALKLAHGLKSLVFDSMYLPKHLEDCLIDAISCLRTLAELKISYSLSSPKLASNERFLQTLRDHPSLCVLDLSRNRLKAHACALLASLIDGQGHSTTHLRRLNIADNMIPWKQLVETGRKMAEARFGMSGKVLEGVSFGSLGSWDIRASVHQQVYATFAPLAHDCDVTNRAHFFADFLAMM